jgi:hypothetical protein
MEDALPENDSRPLPQNATVIHLPVLNGKPKAMAFSAILTRSGWKTCPTAWMRTFATLR